MHSGLSVHQIGDHRQNLRLDEAASACKCLSKGNIQLLVF